MRREQKEIFGENGLTFHYETVRKEKPVVDRPGFPL
jgi:hypothetical protein